MSRRTKSQRGSRETKRQRRGRCLSHLVSFDLLNGGLDLFGNFGADPFGPDILIVLEEVFRAVFTSSLIVGHPGEQFVDCLVAPGAGRSDSPWPDRLRH